jgi:hypothetical protein
LNYAYYDHDTADVTNTLPITEIYWFPVVRGEVLSNSRGEGTWQR